MATAIKKLSGFTPSWLATLRAIGHMTAAVAALFMKSDSVMVTTSISVRAMIGLPWAMCSSRVRASTSAAPVSAMAPASGISAPSRTMMGQSMASYRRRSGITRVSM